MTSPILKMRWDKKFEIKINSSKLDDIPKYKESTLLQYLTDYLVSYFFQRELSRAVVHY